MGHHWVPQKHLCGFQAVDMPDMIWMFDKLNNKSKLVPIKEVSQAKNFYTAENEKSLTYDVEVPAHRVMGKLRNGENIEDIDRSHLTYYLATQIRRVPHSRAKAEAMLPEVALEVVKNTKRHFFAEASKWSWGQVEVSNLMLEIEEIGRRMLLAVPQEVRNTIETPWPFARWVIAIHSMSWRVVHSTGPSLFLASDNPACYFEEFGLANEECELTLPLCKNFMLHCSWQGNNDLEFLTVPERLVKELNRRTAYGATRMIYYHMNAGWILNVAKGTQRQLNRIRW